MTFLVLCASSRLLSDFGKFGVFWRSGTPLLAMSESTACLMCRLLANMLPNSQTTVSIPLPVSGNTNASTQSERPVDRPGIKPETLKALGVRHVSAEEAMALVGTANSGVYIPYPSVKDYGRLRLHEPEPDKKYHQRAKTPPHTYVPKDIALVGGDLLAVEGEFKAISLGEAGFPAIGLSGFYSWRIAVDKKARIFKIEAGFQDAVNRLKPKRIVFIGDSDTATNFQFSDAVVSMVQMLKLPVGLLRIAYDAEDGKGVDDIRGKIGAEAFNSWMQERLRTMLVIDASVERKQLIKQLLDREQASIAKLTGAAKEKAEERLVKLGAWAEPLLLEHIAEYCKLTLETGKASYKSAVKTERVKQKLEKRQKSSTMRAQGNVLECFAIVGSAYHGFSVNPITNHKSSVLSPCHRDFVYNELLAAGYDTKRNSDESTPVCGKIEGLSEMKAAFLYLHRTRYVAIVDRIFRPYGRLVQGDGSSVFNNCQVKPMAPEGKVTSHKDKSIQFTIDWLMALFGWEQLEHFLCILHYTYRNARNHDPRKPLAIFLVGPTDSGKSLLIDFWLPRIFGQTDAGDAHRLLRGENGASSVLRSYVCKLSDKDLGDNGDVTRVRDGMLSLLADYTTGGKLMYQNVSTEEVLNLFAFSSNPDGSVVRLLKGMSESIRSKLAIYNCGVGLKKMSKGKFNNGELERPAEILAKELPAFCSFLESWGSNGATKRYHNTRFGVTAYYATEVAATLQTTPQEAIVAEALADIDEKGVTASRLYNRIIPSNQSLRSISSLRFPAILRQLAETYPTLVKMRVYSDQSTGAVKNTLFDITGKAYRDELEKQRCAQELREQQDREKQDKERLKKSAAASTPQLNSASATKACKMDNQNVTEITVAASVPVQSKSKLGENEERLASDLKLEKVADSPLATMVRQVQQDHPASSASREPNRPAPAVGEKQSSESRPTYNFDEDVPM